MLDLDPYHGALTAFAQRWGITSIELFGSALRDDFGPESDIDVLLTFGSGEAWSLLDLASMKLDLEDVFGRPVDVMTRRAVERSPNWIRRSEILRSAREVYATD